MRKQQFGMGLQKRTHFSPLVLVGVAVPVMLALILGGYFFILPKMGTHAAGAVVNQNCSLIVPANPLTAQGLATPYQLVATDPAQGACNEANTAQAAFVQGAVIDPATGQISVYNPLVVDQGTKPAVAPVVPQLPANGIVALWFGFNGGNLTLQDANNSLAQGRCVNGLNGSVFGQFAYCNAPKFFRAANAAIQAGTLTPPAIGVAKDGMACPTVRDFSVVDMDQSDNVTTTYLADGNGNTAQMNAANAQAIQNSQVLTNASDNRLVTVALDGALGCTPWSVPDLANPGNMATALPLDEIQAAATQAAPVALIPNRDPMVLVNGNLSLTKLNAYRVGVDQKISANPGNSSTGTYCRNLINIAPKRIALDATITLMRPSPDAGAANSLLTFLAQRFAATFGANGLNCTQLIGKDSPITVTTDGNNVAVTATINGQTFGNTGTGMPTPTPVGNTGTGMPTPTPVGNGGTGMPTPTPVGTGNGGTPTPTPVGTGNGGTPTPPNCIINGTTLQGCAGQVTLGNQTCTVSVDKNNQVVIDCPTLKGNPQVVPQGTQPGVDPNAVQTSGPPN
jgi:hypothetical protein